MANDFAPFTYAVAAHQATLRKRDHVGGSDSSLGVAGYHGGAGRVSRCVTRGRACARVADTLWPRAPERRLVLIAFLAPLLLPALAAVLAKVEIVSLWPMGAMTLLPVVLLSSPLVTVPRAAAVWLLAPRSCSRS